MEQQISALTAGCRIDILLVRLDEARMTLTYNVVSNLIYAASADDVDMVVVESKVLMRDRRVLTLNIDKLRAEVAKLAAEIKVGSGGHRNNRVTMALRQS